MQPESNDGRSDPHPRSGPPYLLSVYPAEHERELRFADLWRVVYDGKWIIFGAALLCSVIAVVVALLLTPIYRAEVLMAPVTEDDRGRGLAALAGQFGGLASITGLQFDSASTGTAQALATLQSRLLTEQFIRDHDLAPVLFADSNGHEDTDDLPPTAWEVYQRFDSIRNVSEDLETGLITLAIDWKDAAQAAAWANGLVRKTNQHLRTKAIAEAEENLQFLEGELQAYSAVEIRGAIFSLMEAEMKNAMLANVRAQYAFEVIDPAVPPERRYKPRRTLIVLVAFAGGVFLGFVVVFLRRAMQASAHERAEQ